MKNSIITSAPLFLALTLMPVLAFAHPGHGDDEFASSLAHPVAHLEQSAPLISPAGFGALAGGIVLVSILAIALRARKVADLPVAFRRRDGIGTGSERRANGRPSGDRRRAGGPLV